MTVTDAPTTELGYAGGIAPSFATAGPAGFYVDGLDANVDLRFPASAVIYDRMRREDGQVGSVLRAITLPILGTRWRLVGDDVRPEVMAFLEAELGLNATGTGRTRRRRQGIVWRDHLREALLALPFGFMPFEQVYDVDVAAPGLEDPANPGRLYAHLRKLAPRLPRTIEEVRVARDGGLAGIVQTGTRTGVDPRGTLIPVDRLVMYVNDREGAEWTGSSVLRSAFKHWLIKDSLIRLGAQIVERNGMGIPIVTYDDPSLEHKALALARNLRAGATAGGAIATGMSVSIVGVAGSTADELPRVKYHDEAIGRSLLAMFLNLGHDNGARALGDTFVGIFRNALGAVIANVEETATEHIVRDLVELNYGPDEPYPMLVADSLSEELTAESLKALTEAGVITPDRDLEGHVRTRYGLPGRPAPAEGTAVEDAAGVPAASVGIPALIDAGIISADEGRQMLRLPGAAPGPPAPEDPPGLSSAVTTGDLLLDPEGLTTELAADPLLDRLAAITEQVAALRYPQA